MASGISAVSGGGAGGVSFDSEGNISIPDAPPGGIGSLVGSLVGSGKSFIAEKVDALRSNPVKSVAGMVIPALVGRAVPQLAGILAAAKAAGVLGLIANDIMYDRGPDIMKADFLDDPRGGPESFIDSRALGGSFDAEADLYAQEQADYNTEGRASLDSPYIRPAATATQTQSQSSIPPAANPYLSSPNQYNVGGLDIQYPTRNSQNIIAPTDYRTAAATPLDYANVIAPPGTPYYRNMASGGYVDRPLYPSPRITGR